MMGLAFSRYHLLVTFYVLFSAIIADHTSSVSMVSVDVALQLTLKS